MEARIRSNKIDQTSFCVRMDLGREIKAHNWFKGQVDDAGAIGQTSIRYTRRRWPITHFCFF